ncbi:MAG: phosphotransacetylase family protein [Candidatus Lokiarchaeota archaeon]|nr:phosphotransacetylase family protein [Candidatus Lokiarchaeota archaeon]
MVKAVYLCSLHEHVGKSLLAIGIMLNLQEKGKKVAYFKPVGIPRGAFSDKADRDVGFIQNTVFKTDLPYDIISPVSIPDCYYVDLIDSSKKEGHLISIKQAYEEISKKYDYIIIEGAPSIKKYIRVGLDDVTVAKTLGINELVYIQTESSDKCIDNLFFTKKYFEFRDVKIKGVIFNKIDHEYKARIEELRENHIERYNISIIAIIPKSLELLSPRVSELQWAIGGELLNELAIEGLDQVVETYIIAAMNVQAALKYLRSVKKAVVITGGDRSDVALAALNENVSALILTGFIKPDATVINEANKKKIPIILSPSDTYTTIRNMERVKPSIQEQEINLVKELVNTHFNWDILLK